MIKKFGMTLGGLQQKILNLVLVFILAIVAVCAAVAVYLSSTLTGVVQRSAAQQQDAMNSVSKANVQQILDVTMTQSTNMQAIMADDIFSSVQGDVQTLREYAGYLFEHADEFAPRMVSPPLMKNDGKPSVQLRHEDTVDPAQDESAGLLGNMSELMLSVYTNSDVLNSCFIATANGSIIFVNDRAATAFDDNGQLKSFNVRNRPWYVGAAAEGQLYFTGIELDAFTGISGLVCAAPIYHNGELVAVVGADVFLDNVSNYIKNSTKYGGFTCIVNQDGQIIFSPQTEGTFQALTSNQSQDLRQGDNKALADFIRKAQKENTAVTLLKVDDTEYYLCGSPMETIGWTMLTVVEKKMTDQPTEALLTENKRIIEESTKEYKQNADHSLQTLLILTMVILILGSVSALFVAGRIVRPIERMTQRIGEINGTDLAFEMEDSYRTKDEIEVLAEAFTTLSKRTRNYIQQITHITAEKERIGAELALANRIQADMLPNIFPPFPERSEFDIYASMTPAKEVGGDFYDFFLIDEDHLGMVMADVSGKGIPAALFMMMSKILVNNFAMMGGSPAKVLEQVNAQICRKNDEHMFVTVWFGVLEISSGKVTAANAGHEYPMLKKPNGEFEIFKDKHGFVIGGMEGVRYKEYEFTMEKGSTLFLYTDGVAEATNAANELFGTQRMLDALNIAPEADPKNLLLQMKQSVDEFVGEAPQFDDLTMLAVKLL